MGFNGANGSLSAPGWTDESVAAQGDALTAFMGSGSISTAQSVFGGSSAKFDGAGGRAIWADNNNWNLSNRLFTIEYRFYPLSTASDGFHIAQWSNAANNLGWVVHSDTTFRMAVSTNGTNSFSLGTSAAIISANTWYAACVDFDGTKYRTYINGVMVASSITLRTVFNSTASPTFGAGEIGAFPFNGYLDELRITLDVARYASDGGYTVATVPFPRIACPVAATTIIYIGASNTPYNSVVLNTLPNDVIVVAVLAEVSSGSATTTGVTVDGIAMTKWASGDIQGNGVGVNFAIAFYYGVPGTLGTVTIAGTGTGTGLNIALTVWKLRRAASTPLDQVTGAAANSDTITLGPIQRSTGGVVLGFAMCSGPKLYSEAWSGAETVTEDYDILTNSAQGRAAAFRLSSLTSGSADSLTVTLTSASNRVGGAISFALA